MTVAFRPRCTSIAILTKISRLGAVAPLNECRVQHPRFFPTVFRLRELPNEVILSFCLANFHVYIGDMMEIQIGIPPSGTGILRVLVPASPPAASTVEYYKPNQI